LFGRLDLGGSLFNSRWFDENLILKLRQLIKRSHHGFRVTLGRWFFFNHKKELVYWGLTKYFVTTCSLAVVSSAKPYSDDLT